VRKLVLALAIAFAGAATGSVGCKHPGSQKLEGHWRGLRAEGVGAAQEQANAFALQTEIIARGDKITISTPQARGQQSTYIVDDENKTTVIVHTEKDGAANKETLRFSEDGKTMTWTLGEGRTIVFQKLKE
jgi:hypothetical protein